MSVAQVLKSLLHVVMHFVLASAHLCIRCLCVLKSAAGSTFKDTLSYTLEISMFNISAAAGKAACPSGVLSLPVQPFVL